MDRSQAKRPLNAVNAVTGRIEETAFEQESRPSRGRLRGGS